MIPLAEWAPDIAPLAGSTQQAQNALPLADGYEAVYSPEAISSALGARCQGAISAFDDTATAYNFAGTDTKIYQVTATGVTDRSQAGDYNLDADFNWDFAKWGSDQIIAVGWPANPASPGNTIPQICTMGSAFADMITDETTLCAAHVGVVRSFVVLGYIYDGSNTYPSRVWWSRIGDETKFSVSRQYQSDFSALEGNGGAVQRIIGGEYGVIVCERSIYKMSYVGTPGVFQIDETLPGIGTAYPWSIVQYGDTVFGLFTDGFKAITQGTTPNHIGKNKIDRFVLGVIDKDNTHRVVGAVDPQRLRVWWIYPDTESSDGTPNRAVVYDIVNNRWGYVSQDAEWIYSYLASGYTLEGLSAVSASLDALPASLDSDLWAGGARSLAIYDTDHKIATFTGTAKETILETGETEPSQMRRSMIRRIHPVVDGGAATVSLGHRDRQEDMVNWTPYRSVTESGSAFFRVKGRYVRCRMKLSSGFERALGVDYEHTPLGRR